MQRAHHLAAKNRLTSHAKLAGNVYDAVRTDATGTNVVQANYVVLKTSLPEFTDPRATSGQGIDLDQLAEFSIRVVAVNLDGLFILMDAVNAQMLGHTLSVPGRAMAPLERTEFEEPDYDFKARVHFQDALFEASSSRPV